MATHEGGQRIGVRTTFAADGTASRRLSVYCVNRGASVELAHCSACPRCTGLQLPSDERDGVVTCVPAPAQTTTEGSATLRAKVHAVMSRDVACVTEDAPISRLHALLSEPGVSGVPVVDRAGHPRGFVTKGDLLRTPSRPARRGAGEAPAKAREGFTAADVMTPVVFAVLEETELSRAAALMAVEGIGALPVVMADGSVGGLLTAVDVLRWIARADGFQV